LARKAFNVTISEGVTLADDPCFVAAVGEATHKDVIERGVVGTY
jgi:hypothetical protein